MTLFLAALAICSGGAGVVAASSGQRRKGLHRVALAAGFGLAIWSATFAALLLCGFTSGPARVVKDVVLAAAGAALWLRARRGESALGPAALDSAAIDPAAIDPAAIDPAAIDPAFDPAPRWLKRAFAAACVLASALVVEHVLRFPDGGWDAWMIWNLRARWIARAGPGFLSAFSPDLVFWAHQDYPWLVPGAVAQAFLATGSEAYAIPAALAWLFAALAVALVTLTLAELRGARVGLLGGLVLVTTPCLLAFTANQQSDVPMGAMLLLATSALALALERDDARLLVLAGAGASMAAWTKNEGSVYALAIVASLVLAGQGRAALRFLAGALPGLALLVSFKLLVAHTNDLVHFTSGQTALDRALDLTRWGELSLAWLRRIVYFQNWALWLPAFIVALAVAPRPLAKAPRVLLTALALGCAVYVPMYILQPHPLLWFFRASIDRMFTHLWPSAILATMLALHPGAAAAARPAPRPQG